MSALGHQRTFQELCATCALAPIANIGTQPPIAYYLLKRRQTVQCNAANKKQHDLSSDNDNGVAVYVPVMSRARGVA